MLPMPRPLPSDHPAFGPCITVRRKGVADRIIWGILIVLLVLTGIMLLVAGVFSLAKDKSVGAFVLLMAIGMLVGCWFGIRALARRVEFYHHGIVDRVFSRASEYPFEGAVEFSYNLVRRYYHGIYAGTLVQFRLKVADGRVFRLNTVHKERPVGLSVTIFKKKFKGDDELDVVRDIVSGHVVQTLLQRLRSEVFVPWGKSVGISPDGLTRLRDRPPVLVPWTDVAGLHFVKGGVAIDLIEQDKPLAQVDPTCTNFFPCLELFRLFMDQTHGDLDEDELDEAESRESPAEVQHDRDEPAPS